jgi:hypothetical protein
MHTKSRTDKEEPSLETPHTDNEDPIRAKYLRESDEPKLT